jgi:hypothetical protein
MDFTAYIERQKDIIRRHSERVEGEYVPFETFNDEDEEKFFIELEKMEGLNKRERMRYVEAV